MRPKLALFCCALLEFGGGNFETATHGTSNDRSSIISQPLQRSASFRHEFSGIQLIESYRENRRLFSLDQATLRWVT